MSKRCDPATVFHNLNFNNQHASGQTIIPTADTLEVNNLFRLTNGILNGGRTWSNNELELTNDFAGGTTKFYHHGDEIKVIKWKGRESGLTSSLKFEN